MDMAEFFETTFDKFIFRVKKGYYYSREETWARIDGAVAVVGVTDFLQRRSGDVMCVETLAPDEVVSQGAGFGQMETTKAQIELVSPVSGVVTQVNPAIQQNPEVINEDPYGQGWIVEIRLADDSANMDDLLEAPAYFGLLKKKLSSIPADPKLWAALGPEYFRAVEAQMEEGGG
jgi:glycine cleavage system H protein